MLQWVSKIQTSPDFGWPWSGFQVGSEIWKLKAHYLKLAAILSITIRNLDKNVCILKGLFFEWLRLKLELLPDPLKSEPFEMQSSKSLYLKCLYFDWLDFTSPLCSVWIWNVFEFWVVGFKIPTLLSRSSNITIFSS